MASKLMLFCIFSGILIHNLNSESAESRRKVDIESRKKLLKEYERFEAHVSDTITSLLKNLHQDHECGEEGASEDGTCRKKPEDPEEIPQGDVDSPLDRIENLHGILLALIPLVSLQLEKSVAANVPHPVVKAQLNNSVTFTCDSEGKALSLCFWEKVSKGQRKVIHIDGQVIIEDGGKAEGDGIFNEGNGLEKGECGFKIQTFQADDIGRWECNLVTLSGQALSGAVTLCGSFPNGTLSSIGDSDNACDELRIASNGEIFPWSSYRLPPQVLPQHYTVSIHPNLTTLKVNGSVEIQFEVAEKVNFIVFHSRNLTITETWIKEVIDGNSSDPLNISQMLEYVPHEQMYVELGKGSWLTTGKTYLIGMRFETTINNQEPKGLYLTSCANSMGEIRYLAATHFEPTYARSVFPCFDEPQLRSTFKLTIASDLMYKSLSNVERSFERAVYDGNGMELWQEDIFEKTEKMCTHMVALVICDFDEHQEFFGRGASRISIHFPSGSGSKVENTFAVEKAVQLLDFYDIDFFHYLHPLSKLDLLPTPDFGARPMESWGLTTYPETSSVQHDREQTSSADEQESALVIARGLARQYFGCLVTVKWWNDLWLHESLSSYAQYIGVNHTEPEWKIMEQFVLEETQPALAWDALPSSHSLAVQISDPRKIQAIFDTISYNKGAALIRMIEAVLGDDVLRRGLLDYLREHEYSYAGPDDLWRALSRSANDTVNIKTIMDTWTEQVGFPLVRVRQENLTICAVQERFTVSPGDNSETVMMKWHIPLSYVTDVKPRDMKLVWMENTDFSFPMPFRAGWIKFNIGQTGFYRVQYEGWLWYSLVRDLLSNPTVLSAADRVGLIDDAFVLCKAGRTDVRIPLELSQYLMKEPEYVPWATALSHFREWSQILGEHKAHRFLLKFLLQLIEPVYQKVGWADAGSHSTKLLRGKILAAVVHYGHEEAIREAQTRFNNWMRMGTRVAANIREAVYAAGVKYNGATAWEHCWSRYTAVQISPSERNHLLVAMGSARDPSLLQQYLDSCLDHESIRPQDIPTVYAAVASNPTGRLLAWRHLKVHWNTLENISGKGSFAMGSLIAGVVVHFSNEFDYNEVSSYFAHLDVGSGSRALNQSLEAIRLNIRWLNRNEKLVEDWLKKNVN